VFASPTDEHGSHYKKIRAKAHEDVALDNPGLKTGVIKYTDEGLSPEEVFFRAGGWWKKTPTTVNVNR
jgi:hypothetical protein